MPPDSMVIATSLSNRKARQVNERLLYTPEEASDLLHIGRTMLFELLKSGDIESFTIGRSRRIPREALLDFIERRRSQ